MSPLIPLFTGVLTPEGPKREPSDAPNGASGNDDSEINFLASRPGSRRWLRDAGLVWRLRPAIRPKDPDRESKLATLRALLTRLPGDETTVFMDEVDVNLHPKVG